jgi:flagellar protein FlbD
MIKVTRFNNSVLLINAENIQSVEANPDTVITFINRDRLLVKEPVEEVTHRIVQYRRLHPGEGADRIAAAAAGGLRDACKVRDSGGRGMSKP